VVVIGLFIFVGPNRNLPAHRYILTLSLAIVMVYIGSRLLSKAAIRPIQEAWQKQLDFTADASHELRTPIAVIQTNLDLVMDGPEETVESQMKWLKNIEAENRRMARLVEDLLTLSRADTGQQSLAMEPFMLDETVLETLSLFEPLANEKCIALEVNIQEKTAFRGDRERMKQLIVILADNAFRYTDSGKVTASLSQSERGITLTVSDTGYGMEAEHLSKIFDRFYRAIHTRKLNQDGSGLGLSIARWITREHGGTIQAASTPGAGTVFTVYFPAGGREA
jgi:signal transduction histidine kinase